MWGQADCQSYLYESARIIPTRVGTSVVYISFRPKPQDHPHACGDKCRFRWKIRDVLGSSPRVWGQERTTYQIMDVRRIIPTRVGTSLLPPTSAACIGDHPHACGDKLKKLLTLLIVPGSSPRVWGQVVFFRKIFANLRIIPTRVGTSYNNNYCNSCIRGSSPRVWGQAPFSERL